MLPISRPEGSRKPGYRKSHSLKPNQLEFILRSLGCNFPVHQVVKRFKEEFKELISDSTVQDYRSRPMHQAAINKYRREFENQIISVELASKRRRVEELNKLYDLQLSRKKYEGCMRALAQIQNELEGKNQTNFYSFNQYINLTNDELKERMLENAKKLLELQERKKIDASPIGQTAEINGDRGTPSRTSLSGEQISVEYVQESTA